MRMLRRPLAWLPLLLLPLLLTAAAQDRALVGSWRTEDVDGTVTFVFRADGTGTVSHTAQTDTLGFRYTLDRTKKPAWLDIIARDPEGVERTLLGIVRWEGESALRYHGAIDGEETRPTTFKPGPDKQGLFLFQRAAPE